MIADIGHVALRVPDLDASVDHATRLLGLRETARSDGVVYLTNGAHVPSQKAQHHVLQLSEAPEAALDHVGLQVRDGEALAALRARLDESNVEILSDTPQEDGIGSAIRFLGPDGHVFEAFADMDEVDPAPGQGARIRSFGHVAIKTGETLARSQAFLVDVLGFSLSDFIGAVTPDGYQPFLGFTRCTPVHHSVAVFLGPPGLYHYAFEVSSAQELVDLADILARDGKQLIWGPGRHGAGDNLAIYHYDPAGIIVEHYCDMQMIPDDAGWEPREWLVEDYRGMNTWGPLPDPSIFEQGIPLAALSTAHG